MVTLHVHQQSCPITLNHGWQSSDILASPGSLFLVDWSLKKGQLAKEAAFRVPAGAGEGLAQGCVCRVSGGHPD